MGGRDIQNGQVMEDTSSLGTDKVARMTEHYARSWRLCHVYNS
jgi:hypothetical protein